MSTINLVSLAFDVEPTNKLGASRSRKLKSHTDFRGDFRPCVGMSYQVRGRDVASTWSFIISFKLDDPFRLRQSTDTDPRCSKQSTALDATLVRRVEYARSGCDAVRSMSIDGNRDGRDLYLRLHATDHFHGDVGKACSRRHHTL